MAATNAQQVAINAQTRILKRKAVEDRTGLPRSSIYAAMATGEFPAQIKLTAKSVGWLEHEIEAWLASRIAASRG